MIRCRVQMKVLKFLFYIFIICLDYVLSTSIDKIKENGFELTKKRSGRYPAKTITDANYADDKCTQPSQNIAA